jgi:Tfp pilus assembly protein PilN
MIRINLLESSARKKKRLAVPTGAPVVAIYVLVLLLEGLLLFYWSTVKDDELAAQTALAQEAQAKVQELKKLKDQRDELQKKIEEEQKQAGVFDKLRNKTVGPANLILYLSYALTVPPLSNHAERVVQEQIGWDTRWDPDRAWFTDIKEGADGVILLSGQAISHHDTDEVLKRLRATVHLQDVRFVSAKATTKDKTGPAVIDFKIQAVLNYNPDVGKEEAADSKKGPGDKGGGKKDDKKPAPKKDDGSKQAKAE